MADLRSAGEVRKGDREAGGTAGGAAGTMRRIAVTLRNPAEDPVAFFNRISLVNPVTKQRLLPVFYSDNYVSVLPGESKTIFLEYEPGSGGGTAARDGAGSPQVSVRGWNVEEKLYPIK